MWHRGWRDEENASSSDSDSSSAPSSSSSSSSSSSDSEEEEDYSNVVTLQCVAPITIVIDEEQAEERKEAEETLDGSRFEDGLSRLCQDRDVFELDESGAWVRVEQVRHRFGLEREVFRHPKGGFVIARMRKGGTYLVEEGSLRRRRRENGRTAPTATTTMIAKVDIGAAAAEAEDEDLSERRQERKKRREEKERKKKNVKKDKKESEASVMTEQQPKQPVEKEEEKEEQVDNMQLETSSSSPSASLLEQKTEQQEKEETEEQQAEEEEEEQLIPVMWFWSENDGALWQAFDPATNQMLEEAFHSGVQHVENFVISKRQELTTGKSLLRGSWFWRSSKGHLFPYPEEVATKLEEAYQELHCKASRAPSKRVKVDAQRYCVVKANGQCRQYRSKGGHPKGREVSRGFLFKVSSVVKAE